MSLFLRGNLLLRRTSFFEEATFFEEFLFFEERPSSKNLISSKNSSSSSKNHVSSKKDIFKEPLLHIRRNPSSKNLPFSVFEAEDRTFRSSTFFDAENRKPSPFRSSKSKTEKPHLRSLESKIEDLLSSIFDLRPRISKIPHLRSSEPKNWSKIGRKKRKVGLLRRWGFFEEGGSSIFRVRRTKSPFFSTSSARRTKNLPHLLPSRSEGWTKNPPSTSSSDSFSPAATTIRRSGSSDRCSTLKIGPKIENGPLRIRILGGPTRRRPVLPRPDPPVVCPGFGFDKFTETIGRRYIGQQPGTKIASRPRINC